MAKTKKVVRTRRRERKNVVAGQAHVQSTFNNTIISITDVVGNVISWGLAGSPGLQGKPKVDALRRPDHGRGHREARPRARDALDRGFRTRTGRRPRGGDPLVAGNRFGGQRNHRRHPDPAQRLPPTEAQARLEMANYSGPVCRFCRREGAKLYLKGERCYTPKCAIERRAFAPGMHGQARKRKTSDYGLQLRAKQKARRTYGLLEKQFRNYFELAEREPGVTGINLLRHLELRLDNVIYRLGLGASRKQARQLVSHRHFEVNGKTVNVPSYQLKPGDVLKSQTRKRRHRRGAGGFQGAPGARMAVLQLGGEVRKDSRPTGAPRDGVGRRRAVDRRVLFTVKGVPNWLLTLR